MGILQANFIFHTQIVDLPIFYLLFVIFIDLYDYLILSVYCLLTNPFKNVYSWSLSI